MPDEPDSTGADELFGTSSPAPQAKVCPACGKRFETKEELRFCAACGAPLQPGGGAGAVRVLLAEDALISRRKITAILKRLGCPVFEAANGREAVGMAHREKPDLIILDVHMPDMNGLEALDALRADAAFAKTTIVMLTGEADASVVRTALTRGARDYIRKDSTATELQERLNKHIQALRSRT